MTAATTSIDLWSSKSGYIYGGQYDDASDPGNNPRNSRVAITGGTNVGAATVNSPVVIGSDPYYRWTVEISASDIGLNGGGVLDIFWAGASCSNDAIAGSVTLSVPDAGIMWLLGPVFIALGLLGRKKSK